MFYVVIGDLGLQTHLPPYLAHMGLWAWTQNPLPDRQAFTHSVILSPYFKSFKNLKYIDSVLLSESISLEVPKITARICNFVLLPWHTEFELILSYVFVGTLSLLINFI